MSIESAYLFCPAAQQPVHMQDTNWRELLRFCFARGAYRGAGADLLRNLMRGGGVDNGSLFGVTEGQDGVHAPPTCIPLTL